MTSVRVELLQGPAGRTLVWATSRSTVWTSRASGVPEFVRILDTTMRVGSGSS